MAEPVTRLNDMLASAEFFGTMAESDIAVDFVVIAKCSNMNTGETSVLYARTVGTDVVTELGLLECARQIRGKNDWHDVDDDD